MKTLFIIICCILFINWGLNSHWLHFHDIHWHGHYIDSIADVSGIVIGIIIAVLIAIGVFLGMAVLGGTIVFIVFASLFIATVSAFWPIALIVIACCLISRKGSRNSY
ncbi:hypothetical protein EYS14_24580 [Alteromonadaceae bacterium M269]|nr:hypothetical protein EYS14_24580 [Alteromonadaceae bacterium M269]